MTHRLIGMLILSAVVLTGCDRENSTPPAAGDTGAASSAVADAAAKAAADEAAADAKAVADKAVADAKAVADQAAADAAALADQAAADAEAAADEATADATATVDQAADDVTAKATSLLTQLTQYVKDNKLDQAEQTLAELDAIKGSLSASLQEQIESARTALTAKKSAGSFLK